MAKTAETKSKKPKVKKSKSVETKPLVNFNDSVEQTHNLSNGSIEIKY